MARPRKPIDPTRRRRLMRTARTMFALHGYNGTALSDILSAAEFPRSSFYYFFTDKATLFDAAFSDGLTLLAERVSPPNPAALTTESFWPEIFTFFDELAAAGGDEDTATIAPISRGPPGPGASRSCTRVASRAYSTWTFPRTCMSSWCGALPSRSIGGWPRRPARVQMLASWRTPS